MQFSIRSLLVLTAIAGVAVLLLLQLPPDVACALVAVAGSFLVGPTIALVSAAVVSFLPSDDGANDAGL
jgi:hypothetical protein